MLRELKGPRRVAKARSLKEHPRPFTLGVSCIGGPDVIAGPDLSAELPTMLLPTTVRLTANQRHDVQHLASHVQRGGDVFVTLDRSGFMKNGRQERLRSKGIWVLSPGETVVLLKALYKWA